MPLPCKASGYSMRATSGPVPIPARCWRTGAPKQVELLQHFSNRGQLNPPATRPPHQPRLVELSRWHTSTEPWNRARANSNCNGRHHLDLHRPATGRGAEDRRDIVIENYVAGDAPGPAATKRGIRRSPRHCSAIPVPTSTTAATAAPPNRSLLPRLAAGYPDQDVEIRWASSTPMPSRQLPRCSRCWQRLPPAAHRHASSWDFGQVSAYAAPGGIHYGLTP